MGLDTQLSLLIASDGGQSKQTLHKVPPFFTKFKVTAQFCQAGFRSASGSGSSLRKTAENECASTTLVLTVWYELGNRFYNCCFFNITVCRYLNEPAVP